jgi:uncharacterized protein
MKALAAAFAITTPFLCLAQNPPAGIETLREFDMQLVAAGDWNPIAIDWDARGRMWVAVTTGDPLNPRRMRDRDSILASEGRLNVGSPFCSGPGPVGGFVFHRDGIVAAEGSQIAFLAAGRNREVLFSGFGADDQPAELSNLRPGFDGWIYAVLGRGAGRCTNVVGRRSFGQVAGGIIRFKADGSAIETVSAFKSEGASFDFTWDHELFLSRAEGPHISQLGMPQRYFSSPGISNAASHRKIEDHQTLFVSSAAAERFIQVSPGTPFVRPAGAMIYEGGAWPERYHGNYYVCDPELRLIHEDVISRAESAYFEGTRRFDGEFLIAAPGTFRPHELRFGPDGAMYVLVSAVSPAAKRGLSSPRSPLSGQASLQPHGAIWRIQHRQARHFAVPQFDRAQPQALVQALEHQNGWVRRTAFRLLIEQHTRTAAPALERLATSSRFAHARVSALWALHHLGSLTHSTWTNALEDIHFSVQRNAWLIFVESEAPLTPAIEKVINKQYKDADQRVKLAMLMALVKGPLTAGARESTVKLFPDLKDPWSKSAVLTIALTAPMDVIKLAFASDKSESYRELVVPLVEQLSPENNAVTRVLELTKRHDKAEKLTAAVKEVIAKHQR